MSQLKQIPLVQVEDAGCPSTKPAKKASRNSRYCRQSRGSDMAGFLGMIIVATLAEFLATFFTGIVAVHAPDYQLVHGVGGLSVLEIAFPYAAVIYGVIVTFGQFGAAALAPHVSLALWIADNNRFSLVSLARLFVTMAAGFLGFLAAAGLANVFNNGVAVTTSCAIVPAGVTLFSQIAGTLIGKLFVGHIVLLSLVRFDGAPSGALAIGLVVSALILSLGPITGGAFNLWRYLGVGIVQGGACLTTTTALVELGTFIVAGVLNALLALFVFTENVSARQSKIKSKKN